MLTVVSAKKYQGRQMCRWWSESESVFCKIWNKFSKSESECSPNLTPRRTPGPPRDTCPTVPLSLYHTLQLHFLEIWRSAFLLSLQTLWCSSWPGNFMSNFWKINSSDKHSFDKLDFTCYVSNKINPTFREACLELWSPQFIIFWCGSTAWYVSVNH